MDPETTATIIKYTLIVFGVGCLFSITVLIGSVFRAGMQDYQDEQNNQEKCNSCKNGYEGTHGNGYQPCGCKNIQKETT